MHRLDKKYFALPVMPGRVRHTNLFVDWFRTTSKQGLANPVYFLSHTHADHLAGLCDGWANGHVFCSRIARNLLLQRFKIEPSRIVGIPLGEPTMIERRDIIGPAAPFCVTLIDANHCPGAVMFFFQGSFGNILHTGDCRASPHVVQRVLQLRQKIDTLYLDNTFCDPIFEFPPQEHVTNEIVETISSIKSKIIATGERAQFIISVPAVGKEDLLVQIAQHFKTKISVSTTRLKTIVAAGYDTGDFTSTGDCDNEVWIKAVPLRALTNKSLEEWNERAPGTTIIGIKPTGFACLQSSRKQFDAGQHLFMFPYSLHSSFSELQSFVKAIRPGSVIAASLTQTDDRARLSAMVAPFLYRTDSAPRPSRNTTAALLLKPPTQKILSAAPCAASSASNGVSSASGLVIGQSTTGRGGLSGDGKPATQQPVTPASELDAPFFGVIPVNSNLGDPKSSATASIERAKRRRKGHRTASHTARFARKRKLSLRRSQSHYGPIQKSMPTSHSSIANGQCNMDADDESTSDHDSHRLTLRRRRTMPAACAQIEETLSKPCTSRRLASIMPANSGRSANPVPVIAQRIIPHAGNSDDDSRLHTNEQRTSRAKQHPEKLELLSTNPQQAPQASAGTLKKYFVALQRAQHLKALFSASGHSML